MFLLFKTQSPQGLKKQALVNLEMADALVYNGSILTTNVVPTQAKRYKDNEEGLEQFNDIVEALLSEQVDVYDLEEKPGYWKKEEEHKEEAHKPTPRKTTPKK